MTPTLETVFSLLADERRRTICLALADADRAVLTTEEVADAVFARGDVDKDRDAILVDLHHRHLPKLAAAGVIDYDARSNTARYWGQPTVEKWAQHARAVERRD